MTLPKKLKQIRYDNSKHYGISIAKNWYNRLPDIKAFGIPQSPFNGKPDSRAESGYWFGFTESAEMFLEETEKLIDILIEVRNQPTRHDYDCPAKFDPKECVCCATDLKQKIRESITNWKKFIDDTEKEK